MISSSFLGVYSMAVDTLFLCFCEYFALLSKSLLGQKITRTWGVTNTIEETMKFMSVILYSVHTTCYIDLLICRPTIII